MSNLQLHLLKLYSTDISEQQLQDIKHVLAQYFAAEIDREMNQFWQENDLNNTKIEEWKQAHLRTAYKSK